MIRRTKHGAIIVGTRQCPTCNVPINVIKLPNGYKDTGYMIEDFGCSDETTKNPTNNNCPLHRYNDIEADFWSMFCLSAEIKDANNGS